MQYLVREVILFVHVAAAAALVGTSIVTPVITRRIRSSPTRSSVLAWTESLSLMTRANPAFAVALLVTGISLGLDGWWRQGWFVVSVVSWIVTSVLAGAVVKPSLARISSAASTNTDAPPDAVLDGLRNNRVWLSAENMVLAGDLAILWIMIAKPDLPVSAAILVVCSAVFAGFALLPRRLAATS